MSPGVVGREPELASLRDFTSRIPTGAVALVLEGEAGVGKTTLWEAGLAAARAEGSRVLSARPAESETSLSFSGIGDLLDPVLDEALGSLSAAQNRALSRALVLADDDGRPPDPHAIGVALLTALRALADELPLVVAVDDVQWLDAASAAGLAYAARRLRAEPVGVLLSRRSGVEAPLPGELVRGWPPERVTIVEVGPLDASALHHVVQAHLGVTLPRPVLAEVREASGGNPSTRWRSSARCSAAASLPRAASRCRCRSRSRSSSTADCSRCLRDAAASSSRPRRMRIRPWP